MGAGCGQHVLGAPAPPPCPRPRAGFLLRGTFWATGKDQGGSERYIRPPSILLGQASRAARPAQRPLHSPTFPWQPSTCGRCARAAPRAVLFDRSLGAICSTQLISAAPGGTQRRWVSLEKALLSWCCRARRQAAGRAFALARPRAAVVPGRRGKPPLPGPRTQPLGGQRAPTPAVPHQAGGCYMCKRRWEQWGGPTPR